MTQKGEAEIIKLLQAIAAGVGSILSELRNRPQAPRQTERQIVFIPICPTCGKPLERPK